MLTEATLGFLSTLTYRADAKRQVCCLPLSGIYWEDEMPDIHYLIEIPENDRDQIFRLFTFQPIDQHAQEDAEQCGADAIEALLADADEVTIKENDGVQNISATFDLTKGEIPPQTKRAWSERVFHRRRGAGK